MNKPSKEWQQLRHATLDRVRRQVIDSMHPITTLFVASCTVYLAGLIRFNFLADAGRDYTWFDALQILATAGSGLLLLILSGAIVTLGVVSTRLETVNSES